MSLQPGKDALRGTKLATLRAQADKASRTCAELVKRANEVLPRRRVRLRRGQLGPGLEGRTAEVIEDSAAWTSYGLSVRLRVPRLSGGGYLSDSEDSRRRAWIAVADLDFIP